MGSSVHLIGLVGLAMAVALPHLQRRFDWEHAVGAWGLGWLTTGSLLGLFWAPKELMMGDVGRILYVHVPAAWIALVMFTVAVVGAVAFLLTSRMEWDWLMEAAIEVGVVLNVLLLGLGSIFAKPTWNTWWTWDPRLMASLVMVLTFVGVLILRNQVRSPSQRATWTAVATIIAYLNVPITYMSVQWWATIHAFQSKPTSIDPSMVFVLRMCAWAFLMLAIWFTARRWRIAKHRAQSETPSDLPLMRPTTADA